MPDHLYSQVQDERLGHFRGKQKTKNVSKCCIFFLGLLAVSLIIALVLPTSFRGTVEEKQVEKETIRGLVGIDRKSVSWILQCPVTSNFTNKLDSTVKTFTLYGVIQVDDSIWLCGGNTGDMDPEQSKTCHVLNLVDGSWETMEKKMNLPRRRHVMFLSGRKVVVMGGTTSDVNSKTGCRNTQEVFDLDDPSLGWQLEDCEDNYGCFSSTEIVSIDCV